MERHVYLHIPQRDGKSRLEHIESVYQQTGEYPEGYEPAEVPAGMFLIWSWYWELRQTTRSGFNGAESIQYGEIRSWAELTGRTVSPVYVSRLLIMDNAYISAIQKNKPKSKK